MPTPSRSHESKASSSARLRGLVREYRHAIVVLTMLAALLVALNAWLTPVDEVVDTAAPSPSLTGLPAVPTDAPSAAAAQELEAEPAEAQEPDLETAARCADPPVDEYFSLPLARVPYALLAVDMEKTPAMAYLRAARGESVMALSEGATLPDRRILAWAGAEGIIVCDNGRFQRVDHPQERGGTLTGEWNFEFTVEGSVHGTFTANLVESADGDFAISNPYTGKALQGRRTGTRLEAGVREENSHALQDGGQLVTVVTVGLGGNTDAALSRMELSGSLTMTQTYSNREEVQEPMAIAIVGHRVRLLEAARDAYHETVKQRGREILKTVTADLVDFAEMHKRMPASLEELLAMVEARSPSLRQELEETIDQYNPVPFANEGLKHFPEPYPQSALGDPDAMYRHELEMAAYYGAEAPLPVPVLGLRLTETGERLGIGLTPFGSFTTWQHAVLAPQSESEWLEVRVQSQNNLKQLGLVIKMFENEHHDFTPGGWWSVYPEYLTDLRILTHPLDEPGTLSYDYLTPATNFRRLMEQTHDAEALGNQAPLQFVMSAQPMMVERQPYGEPPGRNVLFADGHVEWMPEREYQQRAREWFGR